MSWRARWAREAAEREAMAAFYAAKPDPGAYRPGDPDPLRDGLLAGWHLHRSRARG